MCLAASYLFASWSQSPERGLVCKENTHAFGNVDQGERLVVEFTVANTARATAKIMNIDKQCDCSNVLLPSHDLAPGAKATVKLDWNVGNKRGDISSYVVLEYRIGDAPEKRRLWLTMKAHVVPDFDYYPIELRFSPDRQSDQCLVVTPRAAPAVQVTGAHSTHRAFAARVSSAGDRVEVSFSPTQWNENAQGDLIVETNSVKEPRLRVPLIVEKVGDK
jgi:hypothetical protein